jgi:predicted metalloenzyme YecM
MTNKEFDQFDRTRQTLKRILRIDTSGLTLDKLALEVEREVTELRLKLVEKVCP